MNISLQALHEAISIKESIAALEARLEKLFGGVVSSVVEHVPLLQPKKGRKKMSAAGRARIAAAQRARWAKSKGTASAATPVVKSKKKKGGISAAGRARLAAAMKARWSAARKKGTTPLNAGKKK